MEMEKLCRYSVRITHPLILSSYELYYASCIHSHVWSSWLQLYVLLITFAHKSYLDHTTLVLLSYPPWLLPSIYWILVYLHLIYTSGTHHFDSCFSETSTLICFLGFWFMYDFMILLIPSSYRSSSLSYIFYTWFLFLALVSVVLMS